MNNAAIKRAAIEKVVTQLRTEDSLARMGVSADLRDLTFYDGQTFEDLTEKQQATATRMYRKALSRAAEHVRQWLVDQGDDVEHLSVGDE